MTSCMYIEGKSDHLEDTILFWNTFGYLLSKSGAVAVHYKGTLEGCQDVFMDTRKEGQAGEPAHIVAGRGTSHPPTFQLAQKVYIFRTLP